MKFMQGLLFGLVLGILLTLFFITEDNIERSENFFSENGQNFFSSSSNNGTNQDTYTSYHTNFDHIKRNQDFYVGKELTIRGNSGLGVEHSASIENESKFHYIVVIDDEGRVLNVKLFYDRSLSSNKEYEFTGIYDKVKKFKFFSYEKDEYFYYLKES